MTNTKHEPYCEKLISHKFECTCRVAGIRIVQEEEDVAARHLAIAHEMLDPIKNPELIAAIVTVGLQRVEEHCLSKGAPHPPGA